MLSYVYISESLCVDPDFVAKILHKAYCICASYDLSLAQLSITIVLYNKCLLSRTNVSYDLSLVYTDE